MRIAYVASSRIPSRAANTVHVLNMCAAFTEEGHPVTLIARGDNSRAATVFDDYALPSRFELELLPLTSPGVLDRLRFLRFVRRAFAKRPFDFAYGRSAYGLLGGVPIDIPFAIDLHVFPASARQRWLEALLFRRRNFLFATAITHAVAAKYTSVYPHLRDRILVAPCAASPAEVTDGPREPGPFRVYYVGHLYQGRGIDLILEIALGQPDIEFHIVGGEDSDIAFWSAQAPPNVRFHGYVKPAELSTHYRRADVCIAPHGRVVAVAGGGGDIAPWMSPMKIFEYFAHNKAVIAADLPAIREVLVSGIEGLLCPPGDVEAWSAAIRLLSLDAELRDRLGGAAKGRLKREFTWSQRALRIVEAARSQWPGVAREVPGNPGF